MIYPLTNRKEIVNSMQLISEAAYKQVEGMSNLLQILLQENKDLHELISKEQAERARIEMDNLNKHIEIQRLDDTIIALISEDY